MESSNFIFLKNINFKIYKDVKLAEKMYKENPKATVGLVRSILERSLKDLYKDKWSEIEKQNLGNILLNKQFIKELGLTKLSIERIHKIRILGNEALHGTINNITENQALEILEYLFYIFKEVYNYSDTSFNSDFILKEEKEIERIRFEEKIKLIELKNISDEKKLIEKKAIEIDKILKHQKKKYKILIFLLIGVILIVSKYFYLLNNKIDKVQGLDISRKVIEDTTEISLSKSIEKVENKTTDDKLIELVEKNYQNYFQKTENLDLNSYYFNLDLENNNISLLPNPLNPYWLDELNWMNWKPTNYNNFFLGSFKIKNKIPLLFVRELGWRGLIYGMYLVPSNQDLNIKIDHLFKTMEIYEIESYLDDTYEKVHPIDNDIFSFKNIFKYEKHYYILSRNEKDKEDLTHFNIIRLDISPKKIIFEKKFPSFEYSPSLLLDERTVYNTPKLASLDEKLSKLYKKAKQSLTGSNESNLLINQRKFLKNRKELGDNIIEIEKLYKLRINEIKIKLENESKKTNITTDTNLNILKSLDGIWEAKQYIPAKQQISSYVNKYINQRIEYQYPYINFKKFSNGLEIEKYKIINSKTGSTYQLINEYNKNADRNHPYVDLPYLPYYVLIKCQNIKTKEILNLAYTYNNNGDNELFLAMIKDDDSIFFDTGFKYLEIGKIDLVFSGSHFKRVSI